MARTRREFMTTATGVAAQAAAVVSASQVFAADADSERQMSPQALRVGLATYSLWQFRNPTYRSIEKCIDLAAEWGFDGVDVLQAQLERDDFPYLQQLKRRAFTQGLDLHGFSTHQTFLT